MSTETAATATAEAVDRLIRMFGAVLLSEDLVDRGYAFREELEPEGSVDAVNVDPDWSRWGSLLRTG